MKTKIKIGQRYSLLKVEALLEKRKGHWYWTTKCKCGNSKVVSSTNLLNGSITSCGCDTFRRQSKSAQTHGQSKTKEYKAWKLMRERCYRKNSKGYKNYGGRGIKVCKRWSKFENFLEDMGLKPTSKHSLDRENVNLGYSPDNCRWATFRVQSNNKRNTIMLTHDGRTMPMMYWATRTGIDRVLLWLRIFRLKWSVSKALTTQVKARPARHGGKLI